jgi:hypothetical protein
VLAELERIQRTAGANILGNDRDDVDDPETEEEPMPATAETYSEEGIEDEDDLAIYRSTLPAARDTSMMDAFMQNGFIFGTPATTSANDAVEIQDTLQIQASSGSQTAAASEPQTAADNPETETEDEATQDAEMTPAAHTPLPPVRRSRRLHASRR